MSNARKELWTFPATRRDVEATVKSTDLLAVAECGMLSSLNADSGTLIVCRAVGRLCKVGQLCENEVDIKGMRA